MNASYSDTSGKKLHEGSFGASAKFPDQALSDFVASSQLAIKSYLLPPDNGGGTSYVSRATSFTIGRDYEGCFDGDMEIYFKVWYARDWLKVTFW